jgi:hypothetical protein
MTVSIGVAFIFTIILQCGPLAEEPKVTHKLQATNSKTHYARQVVKILTQVI